ncbi:MAG: hypothetical protein U0930_19435 [Pirellulales bacterium]
MKSCSEQVDVIELNPVDWSSGIEQQADYGINFGEANTDGWFKFYAF